MYEDKDENRNYEDNEQKLIEARLDNMRKEYRKQEYVAVIIINVVFAIFSYLLYTSVRDISTIKIYENVPAAAIGWFLYGGGLCLALRHEKIENQGRNRAILKAVIFGVFVAVAKMGLDYVIDWISTTWIAKILVVSGVENGLFGLLITVLLFAVFVRGKVRWSVQSANPIAGIVAVLMLYTQGVNILKESYYNVAKMISLNVWLFAVFMILLWWLLNILYDEKENVNKKISRGINVGIALGQLVLLGILISWLNKQNICLPVKFTYPYQVSIGCGCARINAYLSEESEVEIPERIWWAKEIYIDRKVYSNLGADLTIHNIPDGVSVDKLYHKESQCYFTIRGSEAYIDDYVGDEKRVEIPEEVWGRKVTCISWGCFDESPVEEVIIPETVTVIEAAFHDCKNLKQITLPSQLEVIDRYAFIGSGIESIVLPESVKEVGECAFKNSKVKEVAGIENVEYIGAKAFRGTPWEESIEGDFVCIGDVLYLYRGDEEEVIIPSGIKEIRGAFVTDEEYPYPRNVKKVFVPETVTTISEYSFEGQEGLEVYIPETVTSLGISFEYNHTYTIFSSKDKKSYHNGNTGCGNMIITTKGSPAVDYAIEKEQARFQIITEEEMERAISGRDRDEKLDEEIMIQPEAWWIRAYINILSNDNFEFDEYALIYHDEDDIPELVGNNIYASYQICSYSEENKIEYYPEMPYGTYAKEYYYLPKEWHIVCASMGIDKKEHYEECYDLGRGGVMDRILLSELEKNYINFNELHYYSKEEMLDKLYEYRDESEELDRKETEYVFQKETEDFEYLKQIEITSTNGNVYSVMVPKDFEKEEDNAYFTYCGKGFSLVMHAHDFGEISDNSLMQFLDIYGNFDCDDPGYINVRKTDRVEKDGVAYQICTAGGRYDEKPFPSAELVAAIPLGETDILKIELRFQSDSCDQEGIKCLEEISAYYKISVIPFIKLIEEYRVILK